MIEDAFEAIGYRFKDDKVLCEAMTHASSAGHRLESNERLEFLGDAILGYVVSEYLFEAFPQWLEGDLTKIKSAVVSRRACATVSKKLGLIKLLTLGKGMSNRPSVPASVQAAVLESIIAAIYLDGGMRPAKRFILRHMKPLIEVAAASSHQENFKSVLQQYAQRNLPCNPSYMLLDEKGPDHSKAFEVCVEIDGRRFSSAWANSKKEAEQNAALIALQELEVASQDEDGHIILADELTGNTATPKKPKSRSKKKSKSKSKSKPEQD